MLLIGSRAIRFHIPEFRKPRDWDFIGTADDAAELDKFLPRDPRGTQNKYKVHFLYDGDVVELALVESSPYWAKVVETFQDCERMPTAAFGDVIIPPASYLMLTKQCGLIYRIANWHKNLEDVYYMRNLITEIPDRVAALLPDTQKSARDNYARRHNREAFEPVACHPKMRNQPERGLHTRLHAAAALGDSPLVHRSDAWDSFPDESDEVRIQLMRQLFAEEAMVLVGGYAVATAQRNLLSAFEVTNHALRTLIQSGLPEAWRYFGVNHYREILELIPKDAYERFSALMVERQEMENPATVSSTSPNFSDWDPSTAYRAFQ